MVIPTMMSPMSLLTHILKYCLQHWAVFFVCLFFLIQFTGKRDITCISEFTTISLTELRDSKIAERETLTQDLLGKKRIEKFMSGNKCHSG